MSGRVLVATWHPGSKNAVLPVVEKLVEKGAEVSWLEQSDFPDFDVLKMIDVLQQENTDIVLTGTSVQDEQTRQVIEQTLVAAAKLRGIPSLSVLDFWLNYSERFSDYGTKNLAYLPDRIAVMDDLARNAMLKEGFPSHLIAVTGNPYFDSLFNQQEEFTDEDKANIRNNLRIDPDTTLFLYASQPIRETFGMKYGYTEVEALQHLIQGIKTVRKGLNFQFLIKAHPRENKRELERIVEKTGIPIAVDQDYDTRRVLLASDVVISPFSTILIESSYLGLPSISLQPGLEGEDPLITNRLGVTTPVYCASDLGIIIEDLLINDSYRYKLASLARRKGFQTDGNATPRVTELIYELME